MAALRESQLTLYFFQIQYDLSRALSAGEDACRHALDAIPVVEELVHQRDQVLLEKDFLGGHFMET